MILYAIKIVFSKVKKSVRRKKGAKGAVERASRPRWETHCWEPFKQQRNSHSKKPTALNEAARGHSFNFRFPRFKAHTHRKNIPPYSHVFLPASSSFCPYKPRCPFMMCGQMFASPCRFLSSSPDPGKAGCTQRCCVSSRLIMAQISRYRAATISSVLLREFTQRQQVAEYLGGGGWGHQLAVLLKHLSY